MVLCNQQTQFQVLICHKNTTHDANVTFEFAAQTLVKNNAEMPTWDYFETVNLAVVLEEVKVYAFST